ncbi:hypothetical protein [Catelliglobosispora koreensis]|uniref:hypothetical protein n=1 Tax=Catelliglobosispora koreensis TaxID=129052 RepID=UPI00036BB6A4|nr:hypothetical protein [Catelliglobosispora koreensis]
MVSGTSFYVIRETAALAVMVAKYGLTEYQARQIFGEMLLDVGWDFIFNHTAQEIAAIAYHDYRD